MTLEELFYREVMPEGKNNYVLSGQAKVLLALCKVIDELKAAEQSVQPTLLVSGQIEDTLCSCPVCQQGTTTLPQSG
jgi:hypothetical protein